MKRGNTYTQIVTVPVDLTAASEVVLTVKALGLPPIIFTKSEMSIAADTSGTTLAYKLTEEQSLALNEGFFDIDVNWMMDGSRGGTRIERVQVTKTLLNAKIGGGDDTPDPSMPEPDPISLTSEEVRVLNAISPKVTDVTHSGSATVVTIMDISGEHEVEIPDGQQGIQGPAGADGSDGAPGADGSDGQDGADGYSPTATVTKSGGTATITITDKNGTTTATVSDGQDGQDGAPGQDGTNGTDGTDAYVYIRYSAAEPTSDSDMKTTPDAWMGIYSGDAASAPTTYTAYTWYKIKGETGAAGQVQDVQVNGTSVLNAQGVANITPADLSFTEQVTGTTPTIAAKSGIQYVCGEVSTLDITLPASGIVDVVFTSGSTPTVLTITPQTGMTVEWANGFDSTSLEADTLYELNIKMVGTKCLGVAGSWS